MADPLQPGPLKMLAGEGGEPAPFYVIPFDKNGVCIGPRTLDHLVDAAKGATDIFVFSHGWNNDWATATARYDRFIERYVEARRQQWSPPTRDYRPVLAGVFWPSAALVAPWEDAPDIAAAPDVSERPQQLDELGAVTELLPEQRVQRLYELVQRDQLQRSEAEELAALLAPALAGQDDELESAVQAPSPDDLLEVWRRLPADGGRPVSPDDAGGFIEEDATGGPTTASFLDFLNPREAIRIATVLLMKDRAGRVGGGAVATMLRRLIDTADSRVHLVGHSYGGKVVLSALCSGPAPSRPVESVLLLQPAMSCLCFATDVDGHGRPGGYRAALERSRQPVVTTFSSRDVPLTKLFHWAVRRSSDLGEAVIAGAPPSRYAALGGFGPQGAPADVVSVQAKQPPNRYGLAVADKRIVAVQADDAIKGHGDVTNAATAWALLCQVMG